ncbi:MAG: hypothetical protein HY796_03855 [Elusimicrobia bacterium]|nr:hypothetical protein [Elusimicrobiota bacterium]
MKVAPRARPTIGLLHMAAETMTDLSYRKGGGRMAALAQNIQRCQWHVPHHLGFALWEDGLRKPERQPHIDKLAGIIKIDLPSFLDIFTTAFPDSGKACFAY